MFQENEEGGLEVGAKIHNTNVRTLQALLQHKWLKLRGGKTSLRGGKMPPSNPLKKILQTSLFKLLAYMHCRSTETLYMQI